KLKQDLIAMVSHDMATPLASVQLSLEFIASKTAAQLTDGDLVLAKKAEKSVAHLIKLVNDLLTVERLESGKIDLVFDEFELLPMLKDAAEILQEFAHSKQVEIKVQFTDQVLTADQDRLKQVVMNFLTNAIKFSPPQGQITVSAVGENTGVKVMVTDQGRGVPKAEQRLIFERFHQVDRSDAREKGGRGLGLAICKALIEGHGGSIGVTSDPPHGSTFWFVVPNIQN
ncbi:MAG TPA: HAMP domain-containing sensor histidine kinase, partial [Chroococcales cyanobacterium]